MKLPNSLMQKEFLASLAKQILMGRIFSRSMLKVSAGSGPLNVLGQTSKAEATEDAA